jgi:ribosome-binding ATPase YchF (GTP1/OBG family)
MRLINKDDFINELNEFLTEAEKEDLGISNVEEHVINDKHQANYFIKLSKDCEQEIEEIKAFVQAERERYLKKLEEYEQKQLEQIITKKTYYDRALEDFAQRELADSTKRSVKLPNGTLSLKKQQPHYDYVDEQKMLEWCQKFIPDLVKTTIPEPKMTIDKKELKKMAVIEDGCLYINGCEVPGVEVVIKDDKFEVR